MRTNNKHALCIRPAPRRFAVRAPFSVPSSIYTGDKMNSSLLNTLSALQDGVPTNRSSQRSDRFEGRLDGIWATLIAIRMGIENHDLDLKLGRTTSLFDCINQHIAPLINKPDNR